MKLNIALLPGDGIGPEVIDQAVKAVDAVARKFGHEVSWHFAYAGACAIDRYGNAFPEETYRTCLSCDALPGIPAFSIQLAVYQKQPGIFCETYCPLSLVLKHIAGRSMTSYLL